MESTFITEYIDGIPYQKRVVRTMEARKLRMANKPMGIQDAMKEDAMRTIAALHHSNFESGYSNYSIFGRHVPGTDHITQFDTSATATPVYGGIDIDSWSMQDWQNWYTNLVTATGVDAAGETWGAAFDKTSMTGGEWGWYKDTQAFRDFCAQNNLVAKSIILQGQAKAIDVKKNASANAENLLNHTEKIPGNIAGIADSATGSTEKLLKWLPYIAGTVLFVIVGAWTYISISNKKLAK